MKVKVILYVTETGKVLGVFDTLSEADDFHENWCDNYSGKAPSCTFDYLENVKVTRITNHNT